MQKLAEGFLYRYDTEAMAAGASVDPGIPSGTGEGGVMRMLMKPLSLEVGLNSP